MVDSGSYRNDPAAHMHNVVTHDGTPPAEFRAAARKELAAYDTVTVRDDAVTSVAADGDGFVVALGDEVVGSRRRARDRRGRHAARQARARGAVRVRGGALPVLPRPRVRRPARRHPRYVRGPATCPGWSGRSPRGSPCSPTARAHRRAARGSGACAPTGDRRLPEPARRDDQLRRRTARGGRGAVRLDDVDPARAVRRAARPRPNPSGCVEVDAMGRTSVPGVHAAGDMAHVAALPMPMASVMTAAPPARSPPVPSWRYAFALAPSPPLSEAERT